MTIDPERVRQEIDRILSAAKYQGARPNPIGDWLTRFWFRVIDWLDRLISAVPGGPRVFFGILALLVIAAAVWATLRLGERRNRQIEAFDLARISAERGLDPEELEASAAAAAARGDFRESVRLRFVAGLLRLDAKQVIDFTPGVTSAEVAATLRRPGYDELALTFDAIVYGDELAGPPDERAAVEGWRELLESV
ncbi:MAG: hypothetical protein M3488_11020 [Actinomycetota bacterium]|nr:hypothetical protein [Actinomycetota bacterium]